MIKDVSFVLLSGGVGSRSGHSEPKQFCMIAGLEMMAYSLRVAAAHPRVAEIVTNAPEGYLAKTLDICAEFAPDLPVKVLPCGKSRQDSVASLAKAAAQDIIVLHEAARPMITTGMIDELLQAEQDNAGYFTAIPFSMCEINSETGMVSSNVDRGRVFNIQLPQKFSRAALVEAHEVAAAASLQFTEDSVMVSHLVGVDVIALKGFAKNVKVTTPEDFGIISNFMEKEITV